MEVGGQRHAPAALPPGMTRYPLYRGLGRPQGRSGRTIKHSLPNFNILYKFKLYVNSYQALLNYYYYYYYYLHIHLIRHRVMLDCRLCSNQNIDHTF
jgi:hypothetical protein